jgi:hypothetical protein
MSFFPRPAHPGYRQPPPAPAAVQKPAEETPRQSTGAHRTGSIGAVIGIVLTAVTLHGNTPSEVAAYAAIGTGASIAFSVAYDLKNGVRNLQRADLFAILAYYFLTLFEFLFPQKNFDQMLSVDSASHGVIICLLGFLGLIIGRHLCVPKKQPFHTTLTHEIPRSWMLCLFWFAFLIGYSNMLAAVKFDVFEMLQQFMAPRFSQPWSRERLGNWSALLYELSMFIMFLPPMAGIIIARRHRYPVIHLILVGAAFGLTLFYGFAGGTRNVFATYLVTFLIGYSLARPPHHNTELIALASGCAVLMCFATFSMLQFRDIGLKEYLDPNFVAPSRPPEPQTLYVDYNLFSICKLAEFFPYTHEYLGWEIPYQALIRPIPRAIWKSKPVGLSMSIEDAMNMEGLTISASFAGEAYMSGGIPTVIIIALGLGAFMGWWSSLSSPENSEFGHLVYSSGFFAAVITMRSLFVFTTALLPALGAIAFSAVVVRLLVAQTRKFLRPVPPPRRGAMPAPIRPAGRP